MKLLYCEIHAFGNLQNVRMNFQDGLNIFLRNNGWGKTTFCAFVKDMLYGIGEKRTKSVAENDRIKYEPWSGGTFGGALGIEHNGKQYRIERTFGKTPSQDVLRIYDERTKLRSYDFDCYGDAIGEGLLGLGKDGFERALCFGGEQITPAPIDGDLKNRLSRAITNSQGEDVDGAIERLEGAERVLKAKRRPAQGTIDQLEERILRLRDKRRIFEEKARSLPSVQGRLTQLEATMAALNEKIDGCATELSLQGGDSKAAVDNAIKTQLTEQLREAQSRLSDLRCFFGDVAPENVSIAALQTQIDGYEEGKRAEELAKAQALVYEEQQQERRRLTERKTELQNAMENYRLAISERGEELPQDTPKQTGKIVGLIMFALSVCLFAIGAVCFTANTTAGFILLSLGVLLFFISTGVAKKTKSTGAGLSRKANSALQTAYLQAQERLRECQTQLLALPQEDEYLPTAYRRATQEREQCEQALRAEFSRFSFGEIYDFRLALQTLLEKLSAYQTLKQAIDEKTLSLQALPVAGQSIQSGENSSTHSLKTTLFALQSQKEDLLRQHHALQSAYEDALSCKTDAEELTEEETLLLEEYQRLTARYHVLQAAKELLQQAKNNLSETYLTPVANACQSYLRAFGDKPFGICFDGQGSPILKDGGFYRSPNFYSQGHRRLIDFCIRLAVVECVDKSMPSLLILDDPFAEFDDETLRVAKQLLLSLAGNRQILYFTCAQARTL